MILSKMSFGVTYKMICMWVQVTCHVVQLIKHDIYVISSNMSFGATYKTWYWWITIIYTCSNKKNIYKILM